MLKKKLLSTSLQHIRVGQAWDHIKKKKKNLDASSWKLKYFVCGFDYMIGFSILLVKQKSL